MHDEKLKDILMLVTSFIIFMCALFLPINTIIKLVLYIIAYLIVGWEVIWNAIRNISKRQIFDEHFLMLIATIGAFAIGEYPETVIVMWLYQLGELLQDHATEKSKNSIIDLMNLKPDLANIEINGEIVEVSPENVNIGDIITVKPGEKIPLDGIVVEGISELNTQALTGESMPRTVQENSEAFSGSINMSGILKIKVTKKFNESTVSKILELVQNASENKSKSETFINKFAKVYTPIVVLLAVVIAFVPPLIFKDATFSDFIHRACSFLVISCPCALVISIPLGFFVGIGKASKHGILIKGSNYIETLANTKTIALDKTGTLTQGIFKVTKVEPLNISKDELLELAAYAECYSEHPIANSIRAAYGKEIDSNRTSDTHEIHGHGIEAIIDGQKVQIGNSKLMSSAGISYEKIESPFTTLYVAVDGIYSGYILVADAVKDESKKTIRTLKNECKVNKIIMLTGDNKEIAESISKELGVDDSYSNLLPQDKVTKLEEIMKYSTEKNKVMFVGDGINDAPVIMRADVGVAMGSLGSDAAIEAADVVLMNDDISKISYAINLSKNVLKVVKQNIILAITIKLIVLILSAFGITNMWEAVFADVGVSLLAILNSCKGI